MLRALALVAARRWPSRRRRASPATPNTASTATKLADQGASRSSRAQRDRRSAGSAAAARRRSGKRLNYVDLDLRAGAPRASIRARSRTPAPAGAVWKRKGNSWRVDRCENQRQPEAPLLDTPNPPPTFGFNDDWIFQSTAALDLLADTGAQVARTSLSVARASRPTQGKFNWYGSDPLPAPSRRAGSSRSGS